MPNWEMIRDEWETTKITLAVLAKKYDVKLGTLKSRKSREGWSRGHTKKDATPKKKKVAPVKKDAIVKPIILSDDLTDKQKLFCLHYLKYFNATKAYQKAYECDYSTAKTNGNRLLTNTHVRKEIERLKSEQQHGLFIDGMDVIQKYIDIAFADITDFVEFGREEVIDINPITGDDGSIEVNRVKFKDSSEVDGTIITEVKQGKDGVSVKLADKMKALEMLSKYFDLLSENEKKTLQKEKLKAETEKLKLETNSISKSKEDSTLKIEIDYGDDES